MTTDSPQSQGLKEVHEKALIEFDRIQSAVRDERIQCLADRRFYSIAGAQWEGDLQAQFENKPRFEVNKIHLSVIRIINEYRNNRITVDFVSKDGRQDDDLADVCDGLYRADEQDSVAEEAYDNAFEEAVGGGFGAWRLRTKYEDEGDPDDDRQRICIEPIFDADSSVFFDLNAKRQDKADARHCFVLTSMTRESYEEEYDDDPAGWPKDIQQLEFDWATPDVVYVAEYFVIEECKEAIYTWTHLNGDDEKLRESELDEEKIAVLRAVGARETGKRAIKKDKVRKYIMSGSGVLEDCGHIAGSCIPVIPVYGKRWFVDNVERCMGHVRLAKDAQRLKNMQLSKLGEISALSSVEKPLLTPEQVAGHEELWSDDNLTNYPYLLVNPITDMNGNEVASGPIGYTKPPQIPPALAALLQLTEDDMQDLLGNQQAGEQMASNIAQGTVELIQNRLDMQTFIYMSNMAKAMKRCGAVWLSMAKDVIVEGGRHMKTVAADGAVGSVTLMTPALGENGEQTYKNDLSKAKFDVAVEVGPSSSTKRAATVRALTNMMAATQDPETMQILGAMTMMNMEGEGISEIREYFRNKLLRMGAIKPTEEEAQQLAQEMANAPPSPQDEYLRAAAQNEQQKAFNEQADTVLKQAKTDQTRADTVATMVETDAKEQEQALELIEKLGQRVEPPAPGGTEQ